MDSMYQIHVTYFQKTILLRDPPLCFFGGVVWKTLFSRSAFQSRVSAIHVTSQSFDEWFVAAEDLSIFFPSAMLLLLRKTCWCWFFVLYLATEYGISVGLGWVCMCTYIDSDQKKKCTGIIKHFLEQLHRYFLLQSSNN